MKKQKEARFEAICAIQDVVDSKVHLTADEITRAAEFLADETIARNVEMKEASRLKYHNREEMIKYWKGSVRDCLLKDVRVNGGAKHIAKFKRPRDEELKNLNAIREDYLSKGEKGLVAVMDDEIEKRKKLLESRKPASAQRKEPDLSILNDDLKRRLGLLPAEEKEEEDEQANIDELSEQFDADDEEDAS